MGLFVVAVSLMYPDTGATEYCVLYRDLEPLIPDIEED